MALAPPRVTTGLTILLFFFHLFVAAYINTASDRSINHRLIYNKQSVAAIFASLSYDICATKMGKISINPVIFSVCQPALLLWRTIGKCFILNPN